MLVRDVPVRGDPARISGRGLIGEAPARRVAACTIATRPSTGSTGRAATRRRVRPGKPGSRGRLRRFPGRRPADRYRSSAGPAALAIADTTQLVFDLFERGHQPLFRLRRADQERGVDIIGAIRAHRGRLPGRGDGFHGDRPCGASESPAGGSARVDVGAQAEAGPVFPWRQRLAKGPAARCSSAGCSTKIRTFTPASSCPRTIDAGPHCLGP